MTIEQTVEIPADHRLILDVPREIPAGTAILAFTPVAAAPQSARGVSSLRPLKDIDPVKAEEARKRLCGMCKTDGHELDLFMAEKAAEKALEL